MGLQEVLELGLTQGQKRHLLQLPRENEKPQSAERQGRREIPDAWNRARRKFGSCQPEKVDEPHENHPRSYFRDDRRVALNVPRQEQEPRHKEVEDQNKYRQISPFAV